MPLCAPINLNMQNNFDVGEGERELEREGERQREGEKEGEGERETERERERHTQRELEREGETQRGSKLLDCFVINICTKGQQIARDSCGHYFRTENGTARNSPSVKTGS